MVILALLLCARTLADEQPADVDTGDWLCDFCNYPQGWFGTLDIGPGYASDASLKFADYRGITDKGVFASIDGNMHYLDRDGRYFDMYARNLGIDSRQLYIRGGLQGRLELRLSYREIPKYRGYDTLAPYQGTGSNQLSLPPDWVRARTTSEMSALGISLSPVTLEMERKIFKAGLDFRLLGNWRYEAEFQRTEKNGTRAFGAGVFTIQSSHFPAPADFSINRFDTGFEYSNKRSRLRLGFSSFRFSNRYTSVGWENPFTPVGNTDNLRAALEPDSRYYQFNIVGSFRPSSVLRLSGHANMGHISQDVGYIPYSSNPDFDDLSPPRMSLNGEVETLSLGAKMTARLSPKFNLLLSMKYDDRDNQTPTDLYTPVITDLVLREETPNRPYSFERGQYSAQFTYLAENSIGFNAGAKQENIERTLQSVLETKDRIWWGEMSIDRWSAAQFRIRLETSHRDNSPYQPISDPGLQENILMRKFHLADRNRERVVFELDVVPDSRLSANLSYYISRDRYEQSILGLIESDENSVSLDLGYSVNANIGAHAFVSLEDYDSEIFSSDYDRSEPWAADTNDRFVTWGFGLSAEITDKLNISIDYVSSDSRGRISTQSSADESPFPNLTTHLRNANIRLNYQAGERWGLSLLAEHENYDSTDWQIDGLGNDCINAILTLGPDSPDYNVTVLRLLANYSF